MSDYDDHHRAMLSVADSLHNLKNIISCFPKGGDVHTGPSVRASINDDLRAMLAHLNDTEDLSDANNEDSSFPPLKPHRTRVIMNAHVHSRIIGVPPDRMDMRKTSASELNNYNFYK
jgi:hypothetical protein